MTARPLLLAAYGAGLALAWCALPQRAPELPRLSPEGEVAFDIRDEETGQLMPGKLTFVGRAGTPDPQFTRGDVGHEGAGFVAAYNRIFSATGSGATRVPPGSYDVYASRGLEWNLHVDRSLRVPARGRLEIRARLRHAVDTPGWISGDFHVHAASSPDSRVPMVDRVYEFLADGIDVLVSTDHNAVSDYAPFIAELGVGERLTSFAGDELTTKGWGHFGAFPLPQDLEEPGQGAVLVKGRSPQAIFRGVRERAPGAVIDVHHPRLDAKIGYFNLGGLEAREDRAPRPGFSFDFDAVEVLNGYQDADRRSVDRVIADWFSLLDHGHLVTATGNSDTHHLTYNLAGYPRNYVRVDDDRPARLTADALAAAVKSHRAFFTTGPFVSVAVAGHAIGDVAPAPRGRARVEIDVRAADWVSVSRVLLYRGGAEVGRWAVEPSQDPRRFQRTVDVTASRDTYLVVRVDGDEALAPVVGDGRRFVVRPFALTNPVFLDVDGNGRYDPLPHGPHSPPE
jgi:hypothetical protein